MTISTRSADAPAPSLARDLLSLARYYLGGRRLLLALAGLALVAGLTLNWGWLTAAGIAPILISLLPCAAMCALGLCMTRTGGKSCSTNTGVRDTAAAEDTLADGRTDVSSATPIPQVPGAAVVASLAEPEPQPQTGRNTTDA